MADTKLAKYDTFFKEHTLLKLEARAWQQKIGKREVRWNEFKGEFNAILDAAPLPTLVDEATYDQQLMTYKQAFLDSKVDGVHSTSNSFNGSSAEGNPNQEFNFQTLKTFMGPKEEL